MDYFFVNWPILLNPHITNASRRLGKRVLFCPSVVPSSAQLSLPSHTNHPSLAVILSSPSPTIFPFNISNSSLSDHCLFYAPSASHERPLGPATPPLTLSTSRAGQARQRFQKWEIMVGMSHTRTTTTPSSTAHWCLQQLSTCLCCCSLLLLHPPLPPGPASTPPWERGEGAGAAAANSWAAGYPPPPALPYCDS